MADYITEYKRGYTQAISDLTDNLIEYFSKHAHEVYSHVSARDFICDNIDMISEKMKTKQLEYIGKWVAFHQDGMNEVLHGKIIDFISSFVVIKCKNNYIRYIPEKNIVGIYTNKQQCYSVKG